MRDHYDVVVVGSGYGGAIAASRLARVKQAVSVCVLERGREIHPGEYPNSVMTSVREAQAHTASTDLGSPTALFDFHVDNDVSVLVGCGLGGTSLINANVALRPHDRVFDDQHWPVEFRGKGREVLDEYFDRAEAMLGSNPYPDDRPWLKKLDALERSADQLGIPMALPPINVTFEPKVNAAGMKQEACTLCGDCVSGCNVGAKNTVLMNYLPDADRHGAEIFTNCAVRTVLPRDDGKWTVSFDVVGEGRERFHAPTQFVTADVVVLAAGTLGSTEILLRSRNAGLPMSKRIGHRFSGNGDVLGFAYDGDAPVHAAGLGRRPLPPPEESVGPCIAGLIDLADNPEPTQQLIIEDGSPPGAISPGFAPIMWASALAVGKDDGRLEWLARRLRELVELPLGAYRGPVDRSLPYLVMSTDDDHGRLVLDDDRLTVRWNRAGTQPIFDTDDDRLQAASDALGATFIADPLWVLSKQRSLISVHPLGGATMGDDATSGVVNHKSQVFAGPEGTDVHKGLYVMDGAIIPLPLDANPHLTISGLAERAVELLAKDRKWKIDFAGPAPEDPPWDSAMGPDPNGLGPGLRFTEHMSGFFSTKVKKGYKAGYGQGLADASPLEFVLTLRYEDLDALLRDPATPARPTGTVTAPQLAPGRLTVTDGQFILLQPRPERVETWNMRYTLHLLAEDGRRFRFEGFKVLRKRASIHGWPDTTTMYVTIREAADDDEEGDDGKGAVVGRGIIYITLPDFLRQLRTISVVRVSDPGLRRSYLLKFLRLFAGSLFKIYGGLLDAAGRFPHAPPSMPAPAPNRHSPLPEPNTRWYGGDDKWHEGGRPGDDAFLRLTRYRGGDKGPVLLAAGFGMSALSFTIDTVEENLAEYLYEHGYDVWLFDYRAGIALKSSKTQFTIDDIATVDWPTAVKEVRRETHAPSVQALGHCVGSVSLMMAIGAGKLPDVRSAVCAQFTTHIDTSWFNLLKANVRFSEIAGGLGLHLVEPDNRFSPLNVALDLSLRAVPMASRERCGQAVCRWINAIYGCTHRHGELNDATHQALNTMFGVGNTRAFNHLALMVRRGLAVNARGRNVYLRHPERFALPMLLLQGKENYIFHPQGSMRTFRWLQRHNDPGLYRREVLPKYAHLDAMAGRNAARDVYPIILEHLEETAVI